MYIFMSPISYELSSPSPKSNVQSQNLIDLEQDSMITVVQHDYGEVINPNNILS